MLVDADEMKVRNFFVHAYHTHACPARRRPKYPAAGPASRRVSAPRPPWNIPDLGETPRTPGRSPASTLESFLVCGTQAVAKFHHRFWWNTVPSQSGGTVVLEPVRDPLTSDPVGLWSRAFIPLRKPTGRQPIPSKLVNSDGCLNLQTLETRSPFVSHTRVRGDISGWSNRGAYMGLAGYGRLWPDRSPTRPIPAYLTRSVSVPRLFASSRGSRHDMRMELRFLSRGGHRWLSLPIQP